MGFSMQGGSAISALIWDTDIIVPNGRVLKVNHIAETTAAHGIVADSPNSGFGITTAWAAAMGGE